MLNVLEVSGNTLAGCAKVYRFITLCFAAFENPLWTLVYFSRIKTMDPISVPITSTIFVQSW